VARKRVIAVDLDNVLYEWDRTAQYMLREYRGATIHTPSTDWDYIKNHVSHQDWRWLWSDGITQGLFRYGHMVTGARIGLERLAINNALTIVTHRPESAVMDTVDWVSLYLKGIPLSGLHILTHEEPKTQVNADVLIDDKDQNLTDWMAAGRTAVKFERPHNSSWQIYGVPSMYGWKDVGKLLWP
jgi:5'(3')-deoxyribonucleotidase